MGFFGRSSEASPRSPSISHNDLTPSGLEDKENEHGDLQRKKRMLIMAGCGLAVVAAVGVVTFAATSSTDASTGEGLSTTPKPTTAAANGETLVGSTGHLDSVPAESTFTPVATTADAPESANVTLIGDLNALPGTENATTTQTPTTAPVTE
ncbi:hypothetical protein SPRG_16276, partial [Saprolegnia parasitica CBS 223.65]